MVTNITRVNEMFVQLWHTFFVRNNAITHIVYGCPFTIELTNHLKLFSCPRYFVYNIYNCRTICWVNYTLRVEV